MDNEAVGRRIKSIRRKLGMTTEKFAKAFKDNPPSKGTVSKWENGHYLPNNERLKRIAELGGITVNELLYGSTRYRIFNVILNELKKEPSLSVPHYQIFFEDDKEAIEIINMAIKNLTQISNSYYLSDEQILERFNEIAVQEFVRRPYNNKNALKYATSALNEAQAEISSYFYQHDGEGNFTLRNGLSSQFEADIQKEINKTIKQLQSIFEEHYESYDHDEHEHDEEKRIVSEKGISPQLETGLQKEMNKTIKQLQSIRINRDK